MSAVPAATQNVSDGSGRSVSLSGGASLRFTVNVTASIADAAIGLRRPSLQYTRCRPPGSSTVSKWMSATIVSTPPWAAS